jgi:hypothetical protein
MDAGALEALMESILPAVRKRTADLQAKLPFTLFELGRPLLYFSKQAKAGFGTGLCAVLSVPCLSLAVSIFNSVNRPRRGSTPSPSSRMRRGGRL